MHGLQGSMAQIPDSRVVFDRFDGDLLRRELKLLGISNPLFVATAAQGEMLRHELDRLGVSGMALFCEAAMHTPVDVTEKCMTVVEDRDHDGVIAFGGGSAIGLAKAVAVRTELPQIAVPTSFAGSEMTNILGETSDGGKTTRRSPSIQPETVIYDDRLYESMPLDFAMTSGLNALAHSVEALYAPDGLPAIHAIALDSVRSLMKGLRGMRHSQGESGTARTAMIGAHLAGIVLGSVAMSLHHKICHVLGGLFDLPHAPLHSVMLPYVVAYNQQAAETQFSPLADLLGDQEIGSRLRAFALELGAPPSLSAIGFDAIHIPQVVDALVNNPYANPRPLEQDALAAMLQDAAEGTDPASRY